MTFLRFHVDPERRSILGNATCPVVHDKIHNAHIVMDPDLGAQLLSASTMEVAPYVDNISRLTTATGHHFPHIAYAFEYLPLAHNGPRHKELRNKLAQRIKNDGSGLKETIPELVQKHLSLLRQEKRLELMKDVVHPLVDEFLFQLTGAGNIPSNLSGLFDPMLGLRKRQRIDRSIGEVRWSSKDTLPSQEDDALGPRLALAILGNDTLRGTIGTSIGYMLQQFPDKKLSEIRWPAEPPETGVPYIERVSTAREKLGGLEIEAGQTYRILMQSFSYLGKNEAERLRIFGVGAHTCLGRPISLRLWRAVIAQLGRIDRYARIRKYALHEENFVFTVPEKIEVELSD